MTRRRQTSAGGKVVLSTRVRLARNFEKTKFPEWASPQERDETFMMASGAIAAASKDIGLYGPALRVSDAEELSGKLCESRLVSRDLINAEDGAGFAVLTRKRNLPDDALLNSIVVMINEEDHLRIQSFRQGYDLAGAWEAADKFDTALSRHVRYAFSKQLGYLTACPSNIGTGLRASVMVTLPGLLVCNELEPVYRAVERLGYNVRGMYGEGTNSSAPSFLAQISNRGTLGLKEGDVIASLGRVVDEVIRVELQARRYAMAHESLYLADEISRSLGLLKSAMLLGYNEFVSAMHMVRFGLEIGFVRGCSPGDVDNMLLASGDRAIRDIDFGPYSGMLPDMADNDDYPDVMRSIMVQSLLEDAAMEDSSRQAFSNGSKKYSGGSRR